MYWEHAEDNMDVHALSLKEEKKHVKYCYPFLKVPRERPPLLERLQAQRL